MSQRPPASRPGSRSPPDAQRITLPPVQLRDDPPQGGRQSEGQLEAARGAPSQLRTSSQRLPTGQTTPSSEDWRLAPFRDLGVHSILNPTEPEGNGDSIRRLSGATSESPSSAVGPGPYFGTSPTRAGSHTFQGHPAPSGTPPIESYGGNFPKMRKILTPRSPSRTVSSGRAPNRAKIDAQRSPFLPSRGRQHLSELGHSATSEAPPPMPTPPGQTQQQQQHYGFPPTMSTPQVDRRHSGASMQAPGMAPPSQSASPSISVSSHNPSSNQTSPASLVFQGGQGPPVTSGYYPGSSFRSSMGQGGAMQFHGAPAAPEGPYSAPAPLQGGSSLHSSSADSSRQTSASDPIQVLTVQTSQGDFVVPVDVYQASRLADEKRARNAGASARFRQRRKEKEKEASVNIDKLNQQTRELERRVRELEQERDFYRGERDRFRDTVFRNPETRHLAMQAPPSPNSMRGPSFQGPMPPVGAPPQQMGFQQSEQDRAPRRRRTDMHGEFASVPYSHPPGSTLPAVQAAGYAPAPAPRQGPSSLPPLRVDNPNVPQPQGSNVSSATTPSQPPFDPYTRAPYERGWPGDGGRR